MQWYVINLRFLRSSRIAPVLQNDGFQIFVPPKVTNLIFLRSTKEAIDEFMLTSSYGTRMRYMYSRINLCPIVIKDADMDLFIRICSVCDLPIVMTEKPDVKLGDHVRVKEGAFEGAEGYVVRMRKSKRVLIGVGGVIWAATTYIPPEQLEILD